jgi:hypothetical protein
VQHHVERERERATKHITATLFIITLRKVGRRRRRLLVIKIASSDVFFSMTTFNVDQQRKLPSIDYFEDRKKIHSSYEYYGVRQVTQETKNYTRKNTSV